VLAYAAVKRKNIELGWVGVEKERGTLVAVFEADFVHPLWNFAHYNLVSVYALNRMNLSKRYKRYFNLQGAVGVNTLWLVGSKVLRGFFW